MKPIGEAGILDSSDLFISFPSDFARKNLFFLDRCGHYFLNRHYLISRSSPTEIRFLALFVVKGSLSLVVGSRDYTIHENEIAIIDTRSYHIYAANEPTEMYWIGFDGCSSEALVTEIARSGHVYIPVSLSRIMDIMREIMDGFRRQDPLCEEMTSGYIHMMLSDVLTRTRIKKKARDSIIGDIMKYIQSHYQEQLTLTGLAKIACLNPSYFSTKFKEETGISPKEYILNTRMNAAKILLSGTGLSISQVAQATGFQNDAYFSYYFRKKLGTSPSEYRHSH